MSDIQPKMESLEKLLIIYCQIIYNHLVTHAVTCLNMGSTPAASTNSKADRCYFLIETTAYRPFPFLQVRLLFKLVHSVRFFGTFDARSGVKSLLWKSISFFDEIMTPFATETLKSDKFRHTQLLSCGGVDILRWVNFECRFSPLVGHYSTLIHTPS